MIRDLAQVARFARQHHRRQWSVTQFVSSIGASLIFAPIEGGRIPGISCRAGTMTVIGIDERLVGTRFYVPVLAHEITHLILGSTGVWLCAPYGAHTRVAESWTSPTERNAWFGAALLAVDRKRIAQFKDGEALPEDIATECMVPVEFVNFAYSVHQAVESELPLHLRAANIAYERWMTYTTSALRHQ